MTHRPSYLLQHASLHRAGDQLETVLCYIYGLAVGGGTDSGKWAKEWPLTLKIEKATWRFLEFEFDIELIDMRHGFKKE